MVFKVYLYVSLLLGLCSCMRSEEEERRARIVETIPKLALEENSRQTVKTLISLLNKQGPKGLPYIETALYDGNSVKSKNACIVIASLYFEESIEVLDRYINSKKSVQDKKDIFLIAIIHHKRPSILKLALKLMKDPELAISNLGYEWFIRKLIGNIPEGYNPEIWVNIGENGEENGPSFEYRKRVAKKWEEWLKNNFNQLSYNHTTQRIGKRTGGDLGVLQKLKEKEEEGTLLSN